MNDSVSRHEVRFVYFDVGGTMLRVEPSVGEVYSRTARAHGFRIPADWLAGRFRAAWSAALRRSAERSHTCSDEILRDEWFAIVRDTFGDRVPFTRLRPLFDDLYEEFVSVSAWRLENETRETIRRLRTLGVRLGVLSNWDSRLPLTLGRLGVADLFDVQVVSYEVGFEKPHPRIFEEAIVRAEEEPRRILHVGDSWESDILPARRVGMKTLWIAPESERRERRDAGAGASRFADLSARDWGSLLGPRPDGC